MKRTHSIVMLIVVCVAFPNVARPLKDNAGRGKRESSPDRRAVDYLAKVMDQFHSTFDVYTDADAAGNHFVVRPRMSNYDRARKPADAERTAPAMDEAWTDNPHSGLTCIKASFKSEVANSEFNWGAWYFMNGVQRDQGSPQVRPKGTSLNVTLESNKSNGLVVPEPNWGHYPNAGVDLTGASKLTFWARGEKGGERVEFFALGVGWDADLKAVSRTNVRQKDPLTGNPFAYADSSPKITTGYVTLSREWKQYTLVLKGINLTYVLGGFGWAASATENGLRDISFYLDDISYDIARLNEPRFLVSYETVRSDKDIDKVMRNAAHTYDNALALIAFLAAGDTRRAGLIADALLYAQDHDRFYPQDATLAGIYRDSLRNAYQGGDLLLPPGWISSGRTNTVRMPGWYVKAASDTALFRKGDIKNPARLICKVKESRDPVSLFLLERISPGALHQLAEHECAGPQSNDLQHVLTSELNRLLTQVFNEVCIYDARRFEGIRLDENIRKQLAKPPQGEALFRLNRMLLEAAYPDEIERIGEQWLEDSYSVSLDTGNVAWAMLALLAYHEIAAKTGDDKYLNAAKSMGEWVHRNCFDLRGNGGYTGGFKGWESELGKTPENTCEISKKATYKSTEHNIDLYAAFERLYLITFDTKWRGRATHARSFLEKMWDEKEGKFWTGTDRDGTTINTSVIPLDIQPWAVLSLSQSLSGEDGKKALKYADAHMKIEGRGYDYSRRYSVKLGSYQDREGTWYEGTAQMAVAYHFAGEEANWQELMSLLKSAQFKSGGLPASDKEDGLRTGFKLDDGGCIRYFNRSHVGATAWLVLAERGVNPFWMGTKK